MQEFRFTSYAPGDEAHILDLFPRAYGGRTMTERYWRWRFQDNPAGHHYIELAWVGEQLVGHYAISPVVVTLEGQDVLTALSGTTMIHPDFQRRGLFWTLGERLYERLDREGFLCVWGFPNIKSHKGIVRDLKWQDIREIPYFQLDLSHTPRPHEIAPSIEEVTEFDGRFDDLWNAVKTDYRILVRRDRRYLQWRFTPLPDDGWRTYRILVYVEGGKLCGYAVCNTYLNQHLQIVDILTINELSVALELVNAATVFALQENRRTVRMWLPVEHPLHWALESKGFTGQSPLTFFGARLFAPSREILRLIHMFRWYYMMSDSDVF